MPNLITLALDASCATATICLQDAKDNTWMKIRHGNAHGSFLLSEIELLLQQAQLTFNDIQQLVLGIGPGSFTGVRLSAALFAGIATSMSITPVIRHISSLAITALQSDVQRVWVIEDARAGDAYCGYYQDGIAIADEFCLPWHKLAKSSALDNASLTNENMIVCQPESLVVLQQHFDVKHIVPIAHQRADALLRALAIAKIAAANFIWQPCYLRPPQATKNLHKNSVK